MVNRHSNYCGHRWCAAGQSCAATRRFWCVCTPQWSHVQHQTVSSSARAQAVMPTVALCSLISRRFVFVLKPKSVMQTATDVRKMAKPSFNRFWNTIPMTHVMLSSSAMTHRGWWIQLRKKWMGLFFYKTNVDFSIIKMSLVASGELIVDATCHMLVWIHHY